MKKLLVTILALALCLSFAACGNQDPEALTQPSNATLSTTEGKPDKNWPNDELAAQCLEALIQSPNAQNAALCLTENSQDRAQDMVDYYQGHPVRVKAEYKARFGDYDIFAYEAYDPETNELLESGCGLFYRNDDHYLICVNLATMEEAITPFYCSLCSGSGVTYTGTRTACGICGGSGWQYIPNAYYDSAMNMWMGQNVGCGGCGGSGWIGDHTSTPCIGCGGSGLKFP